MATFLLIHGAYQGGWIWTHVAARLRAAGHRVHAPSLDGCAERTHALRPGITTESHAAELAALMTYEDLRETILVGTSTGGMALCKTAELARERVRHLVLADALALKDGERLGDIVKRRPGETTELATGPTRADVEGRLFAELPPDIRAWALERYTLHPIGVMDQPVKLPTFWSQDWRATVIYCPRSSNPPEAHQRRAADSLKARWQVIDTGHYPMLSTPDALAQRLLEIARSG
jgi:pimeloyl-ACP methyl ester carboxylesterase